MVHRSRWVNTALVGNFLSFVGLFLRPTRGVEDGLFISFIVWESVALDEIDFLSDLRDVRWVSDEDFSILFLIYFFNVLSLNQTSCSFSCLFIIASLSSSTDSIRVFFFFFLNRKIGDLLIAGSLLSLGVALPARYSPKHPNLLGIDSCSLEEADKREYSAEDDSSSMVPRWLL